IGNQGLGKSIVTNASNLNVQTGQNAYVTNSLPLTLNSAIGNYVVVTNAGNIFATGQIRTSNIVLQTASGSNGSITVGGNFTASNSANLSADGSGTIIQTGTAISTPRLTI